MRGSQLATCSKLDVRRRHVAAGAGRTTAETDAAAPEPDVASGKADATTAEADAAAPEPDVASGKVNTASRECDTAAAECDTTTRDPWPGRLPACVKVCS